MSIQTITVPLAFGAGGDFTIFPFAYAPSIPDTPDCWLATGTVKAVRLNSASPPSVVAVTIADYVDAEGVQEAAGSGAIDPSPIHGQFPISLVRGVAQTDPAEDGNGVSILAKGPNEGANGGVHIISENATFASSLSHPDRKLVGRITDLTSGTDTAREGCWRCPNGMAINVSVNAASTINLLIDIELAKPGAAFYREWQRKDFRSRRFAIAATGTSGADTVLSIASASQYVPVGREFKAKFVGTSVADNGSIPLAGQELTLVAEALSSGSFLLRVLGFNTAGQTLSGLSGNVDIVWPYGGIR